MTEDEKDKIVRRVLERMNGEDRKWLEEFAEVYCGISYRELITGLEEYIRTAGQEHVHLGVSSPDAPPELWDKFENVTGITVPQDLRDEWGPFTCSC